MIKKYISALSSIAILSSVLGFVQEANAVLFVEQFDGASVLNLTDADNLIAGGSPSGSTQENFIDFYDGSGPTGRSFLDQAFPGIQTDNFAIRATTNIIIPSTGDYTFLTNADDGVRLSIDGTAIITDSSLHFPEDRLSAPINLSAGAHSLELVFFEAGGGASLELWAASGIQAGFNSNFDLIGDTANGGLATVPTSVPFDVSPNTGIILLLGLLGGHQVWKKRKLKSEILGLKTSK